MMREIDLTNCFLLRDESTQSSRNSHNKKPLDYRSTEQIRRNGTPPFSATEKSYAAWQCG